MPMILLPDYGWSGGIPERVDSMSVSRAGQKVISIVESADPVWNMNMVSVNLSRPQWADMVALKTEAGNGVRTVLYTLPRGIAVPQTYWLDPENSILDDTGLLGLVTDGFFISISSVTSGLVLKRGDWIGLKSGDYRSLHMVMADAVATGGGIDLRVEPAIPPYIAAGATVDFRNPKLNTRVLPGSFQIGNEYAPVASFTLVEVPK